jgi:iron(III) transport system ATP-binding protein
VFIDVRGVSKLFPAQGRQGGESVYALREISLEVEAGEMIALVGASGSGKTTLLRCIAGLETPSSGEIRIDGQVVFSGESGFSMPTERRNLGLIFQSYALWPNMTVFDNVGYPLARRGLSKEKRRAPVANYLDLVGCGDLGERFPHQLSGGQQQRVALARALVYEPSLVLFDEPLSNLDANLREQLRYYLREIQRRLRFTAVYVTHDQSEAFFLGDRVAIMDQGALFQTGPADEVYNRPASAMVAAFVGAANSITGRVSVAEGRYLFSSEDLGTVDVTAAHHPAVQEDCPAVLMIRPELIMASPPDGQEISGTVLDRIDLGGYSEYVLELSSGQRWRARMPRGCPLLEPSSQAGISIAVKGAFVYPS